MKVTIAYQCDLHDIPKTVCELLGNIKENDLAHLEISIQDAISSSNESNVTETLAAMDDARLQLAKLDQKLLDFGSILGGYAKADTNIKLGIKPEDELSSVGEVSQGTQEVAAQDILSIDGDDNTHD